MKGFVYLIISFAFANQLSAQEKCASTSYLQEKLKTDQQLASRMNAIEKFTTEINAGSENMRITQGDNGVISIPVVVHVLYHINDEKISTATVMSQIESLNKYFRRRNADTVNAPLFFRQMGADCNIEFKLAISDPKRKSTTGIVYKYTPITKWKNDDQMKFSSTMGDDAWDPSGYLNIWVCNLDRFAGYATMPGGEMNKDGVVINYSTFGTNGSTSGYNMGKTAVHEVGHWLNLKHIWGDDYCGDDGVGDTPKQASYTVGCPKTSRVTCGNGPYGDMYMNYMDYTNDDCINMFTEGQRARMRSLFVAGGARQTILSSKGLDAALISAAALPDEDPKWLHPQLYPNPAVSQLTIDLVYDSRWLGKTISISNLQGQNVMNLQITSKKLEVDISKLQPGVYFIAAKKDDGESMKQRFIKL